MRSAKSPLVFPGDGPHEREPCSRGSSQFTERIVYILPVASSRFFIAKGASPSRNSVFTHSWLLGIRPLENLGVRHPVSSAFQALSHRGLSISESEPQLFSVADRALEMTSAQAAFAVTCVISSGLMNSLVVFRNRLRLKDRKPVILTIRPIRYSSSLLQMISFLLL